MPTSNSIPTQWVKGVFKGEQAKYIRGLANEGIGYRIIQEVDNRTVIAAFKRPMDSAMPDHLAPITEPRELKKLSGGTHRG